MTGTPSRFTSFLLTCCLAFFWTSRASLRSSSISLRSCKFSCCSCSRSSLTPVQSVRASARELCRRRTSSWERDSSSLYLRVSVWKQSEVKSKRAPNLMCRILTVNLYYTHSISIFFSLFCVLCRVRLMSSFILSASRHL